MRFDKLMVAATLALAASPALSQASKEAKAPKEAKASNRQYGMAGCGLGSVVIGPQGNQVFGATTNGTSYNQAFGISSGTSNCKTDAQLQAEQRQIDFLTANFRTLQKEMAQGGGETVNAYATVLGCEAAVIPQVTSSLVKAYDKIFAAPGTHGVLDASRTHIHSDATLAPACKFVG